MANQGIPVIGPLLNKIIGTRNERFVKRYLARVHAINGLEEDVRRLSDEELRGMLPKFKARLREGVSADTLLVEAFAVAREAMDRAVGIRNAFNPDIEFDASRLPAGAREAYEATRAAMASMEPAAPEGRYLGGSAPVPGWLQGDIPLEVYAAVRELYPESRPPFRARPFDVQLIGAMVLYQGKIAEMKTGEGKTIVAPMACYLAAIEGRKVHVVTVNDYLVQRDRDWTAPFFHALGLTVGAIHPQHMQREDEKRRMYRCGVVYGTTSEFGFDYLRDNMKKSVDQQVQRTRDFAIVDEVDSILIDEARTPLIISGPANEDEPRYELADKLARHLVEKQKPWQQADERVQRCKERIKGLEGDIRQARDKSAVPELERQLVEAKQELGPLESERAQHTQYFEIKLDRRQAHLLHDGIAEAQRVAGVGSFYVDQNMDIPHLLEQSLRAHAVYMRDRDYVILPVPDPFTGRTEPGIVIVDTFTGRPMIGRQWSDGLHQAVECKEKVPIKQETQTVATVTIQNFFKMYKSLAGMTGTADTEAQEFHDIYHLDVVSIPTNKPVVRTDYDDQMYLREKDKWAGIVEEIKRFHDLGRPILVGTTSVEKSERLSKMLTSKHSITHEVLNAKQHERESHIIEGAGQLGAVMIATNMAGRGTDIKLGRFDRETLLAHWLRRGLCPRTVTVEATDEQLREAVYRKIGASELELSKREVEQMPFEELELRLLRAWAIAHTYASPKRVESMDADALRAELDATGRTGLHRIRWFQDIEELGGLHVIGTERHESRRIDNQLRGRSGRQGDRGSSRFFVSFEDDLMKMFAGETQMKVLARLGMKEGDSIEHPWLSKAVQRAQKKVEERNFQIRKNILEYDEVMEHQRQRFYGLRQRVLEGRDLKGLIIEYLDSAITAACDEYLAKDYPRECIAQFARERLDCSVNPERLRNLEPYEIEKKIRDEAKADARQMIDITLGEYIPVEGSEIGVDFDSAGLLNWAKSRFGVELDPGEIRQGGAAERTHIARLLEDAAAAQIEAADLSGLEAFLARDYGPQQLSEWVKRKFDLDVPVAEIVAAIEDEERTPHDAILQRARDLYARREAEYPVEFQMELTMMLMRQDAKRAASHLVSWANRRLGMELTEDELRRTPPNVLRERLIERSREFLSSGRLESEIEAALAHPDNQALSAHLSERFHMRLPDWFDDLRGEERADAIRGRVESVLRAEVLQLEQTILLDTLDGSWKDHLHGMDQLREVINYRAFSQRDPRTEFKREGSRLFSLMMDTVRDRITDYVFVARLTPMVSPAPRPTPPPRESVESAEAGSEEIISGPGLDPPPRPPAPARAQAAPAPSDAQSQLDAARAAKSADRGQQRRR